MEINKIVVNDKDPDKKINVAAYCRVSTDNTDQLESLDAQRSHYESFIRLHSDWKYAGTYYDSGVTGTKADIRDGLQNMISDCHAGKIGLILIKSVSRLARNTVDCLNIIRDLKNIGVSVYFEKENINTSRMDGELMLTLLSSMAEEESASISQNVKWSVKNNFRNNSFKQVYMPYGYKKDTDGNMIVDSEKAEIVRQIFYACISGQSTHSIANMLNQINIPTSRNVKWSSTSVRGIIGNERYTGDAVFQKTYTDSRFKRHRNKGEVDQYFAQNHHEAIVSHDTFEKANAVIAQRASEKGILTGNEKYHTRYAFSGKIICGECGDKFKRRIHDKGSEIAWTCATHIEDKNKCSIKYVRDDEIKAAFVTMLNKLIFSRKVLLLPYLHELKDSNPNNKVMDELKNNLAQNNSKYDILRNPVCYNRCQ